LGMRSVMYAARVKRCIPGLDVVFAEKIAVVIEDELVVIGVAVEEGHPQRLWILFERARKEAAHYGSFGQERRMRTRRKMRAVTHDGPYVTKVQFPNREITLPADYIYRVERIDDF